MKLNVNGSDVEISAPPEMPLLWILREHCNLTAAKLVCGHAVCGGCIVSVGGAQAHPCIMTAAEVGDQPVITLEGQKGPIAEAVFQAWLELDVAQCGFCQPAQINSAIVLLTHVPTPSDEQINEAMKHNLCRCATYPRIRQAIKLASSRLGDK